MNKYTVVTVDYNSCLHTLALVDNLESIRRETGTSINLVVVDNASSAENLEKLGVHTSHQKWVQLIRNPRNIGYFRGLNLGLEQIPKMEQDKIIICNNDITFDSNFFELLSATALPSGTLVVAPRVTTLDGREQNPHVVDGVSRFRLFCYDLYFSSYWLGCLLMKVASRLNKKIRNQNQIGRAHV